MTAPTIPGLFDVPIAPSLSPVARHTSYMGAVDAQERAGRQALALLAAYRRYGPLSDAEAAERLGIERTSINARRCGLIKLGLVDPQPKGTRKNPKTLINNATWGI